MIHILSLIILDYKIILQCIFNCFQCTDVREVNLVYQIHNGSCHKQQMINNDKSKSWETAFTIMNWFLKWNVSF